MKKSAIALAGLGALSFLGTARAEVGMTASVSTVGLGVHYSFPVGTALNGRIGLNALRRSDTDSTNDVDYDFKLKLATVDALVDYFPMKGGFRVTGGIVYNGNKFEANGRPKSNGTYTFNGRTYPAAAVGSVNAEVTFNKLAPYLGIGWGNAVAADKTWGFSVDVGAIFQGSPKSALSNRGCTATAPICSQIASDVQVENRSFQAEMEDFKVLPVVRVGVSIKF